MNFLKTALVVALGLGLTWAAEQVTGTAAGVFAQDTAEEISDKAVEKQLQEAQQQLNGGDADELKDFVPSEPLSADVAIEFPSDI